MALIVSTASVEGRSPMPDATSSNREREKKKITRRGKAPPISLTLLCPEWWENTPKPLPKMKVRKV